MRLNGDHAALKDDMDDRRLGTTELNLSAPGFGSSPLGNTYDAVTSEQIRGSVDVTIDPKTLEAVRNAIGISFQTTWSSGLPGRSH